MLINITLGDILDSPHRRWFVARGWAAASPNTATVADKSWAKILKQGMMVSCRKALTGWKENVMNKENTVPAQGGAQTM